MLISQIVRFSNPDRYEYTEIASKNRSGGLAQLRVAHKKVPIYENPAARERCHVYLLDKYFRKQSPKAIEKGWFYCQPLQNVPADPNAPWFAAIPCGRNLLGRVVREIFQEAGIDEQKSNRSLRAAGVDEKVIQSRSGHRSLDALRMYERVTPAQQQAVSNILTSGEKKQYREEVQLVSAASPQPVDLPISLQSMATFQSTANGPAHSGINCYGCSVNIYQGPVNQHTGQREHELD